ncbi:nucleoside-diphosphate-sugar epimerase [Penicillium angulare]|uniref:nucleoside-diphosphate-sugar epimerase n=1 Tax=Penicillium angulare TaxID=116970 RepID=UPI0025420242|nr:nucleoside-diphosphate-sugar epimerase [Penicillium angulare]KAJ5291305.1 nucleoside-diphosphate-sugar epimerase [Penicillium angulare]
MKTVFITGASGYIGGDILTELIEKYPVYNYRLLVRGERSKAEIKSVYPSVSIVCGDLNDSDILTEESAGADIVIHTADAADHLSAAQAIAKGALKMHTPDRPLYWLHTSGAGLLSFYDEEAKVYGERSSRIHDDVKDIDEILSLPDRAFHRVVDKTVLHAGAENPAVLKTAIISPTTVYGTGRGPCSQRSRQIYEMAKFILKENKIPVVGRGQSIGSNVHVRSVTRLNMHLFEAAIQQRDENLFWGSNAYYLVEQGEHCWGDVANSIAQKATEEGLLSEPHERIELDMKSAYKLAGFEATSWGYNMRCRASRARSLLGWQPSGLSLDDELPQIIREEYNRLQQD